MVIRAFHALEYPRSIPSPNHLITFRVDERNDQRALVERIFDRFIAETLILRIHPVLDHRLHITLVTQVIIENTVVHQQRRLFGSELVAPYLHLTTDRLIDFGAKIIGIPLTFQKRIRRVIFKIGFVAVIMLHKHFPATGTPCNHDYEQ
jgi:hypothetical protein